MKNLLIFAVILFSSLTSIGQQKKLNEVEKSKIETFSDRPGSLLKKEFIDIGIFNSIKIQVLKITDISTGNTTTGVRLEKAAGSDYKSDHVVFLDNDEIDSFVKAIDYMLNNVINKPLPDDYVEYNFQSRSGFKAATYKSSEGKWSGFLQLDKYDSDSELFLSSDELSKFKDLILLAKSKF